MEKIVTVVVPVYNMENYLSRCLDSLIVSEELLNKIEVLVINDGSKDNSINIMKDYEKRYPSTFRVIDKENGGHGSAWNVGLKESQGKYISFLDSDDWYDKDNFEDLLLKIDDADAYMTKVIIRHNIHSKRDYVFNSDYYLDLTDGQLYTPDNLEFNDRIHIFYFQNMIYKTSILREANFHFMEKTSYDDTILDIVGMLTIKDFVFFDKILYNYFHEREGQSIYEPVNDKKVSQLYNVFLNCFDYYNNYATNKNINNNRRVLIEKFALSKFNSLLKESICALPYNSAKKYLSKIKSDFYKGTLYELIKPQLDSMYEGPILFIWLKYGLKHVYYRKAVKLVKTPFGKTLQRIKHCEFSKMNKE